MSLARNMVRDLTMAAHHTNGSWVLLHEKPHMNIYGLPSTKWQSSSINVHATTDIRQPFAAVAAALVTTTTPQYQSMMRTLSDDFMDGQVLETIVAPSMLHPYRHVSLKGAAFKEGSFKKYKDFVYLEVRRTCVPFRFRDSTIIFIIMIWITITSFIIRWLQ
jgi:hypothetical protein